MSEFNEPSRPRGTVVKMGILSGTAGDGIGGELWVGGDGTLYRVKTYFCDHEDFRAWSRLPSDYFQRYPDALASLKR